MLRLPRLLSDGMVLQQGKKAHIWGWNVPGCEVMVTFLGKEYMATTGKEGKFSLFLDEQEPGGPYSMEIKDGQGEEKVLCDIWIGDVFICSGQSNMELPMERVKDNYPDEIAKCKNPAIRTFKITEHADFHGPLNDHLSGEWKGADKDTILEFSATAYFFAKQMCSLTGIPVGLIDASLGGSRIESWMSREMLEGYDEFLELAEQYADDDFVKTRMLRNEKIAAEWHQEVDTSDKGLKESWKDGIASGEEDEWKEAEIPFFFADTALAGFIGSVWFCRRFTISDKLAGKEAKLWLGTIVDSDCVYVNGQFVGQTEYQYPPRKYVIPKGLLKAGENTIVIRVKCENGYGRFTPDKEYAVFTDEERVELQGTWYYRIGAECKQIEENDFINWKPTGLYNGMMAPCHPYTIRGILWYQGEANSWKPDNYFDLTQRMIKGYREKWGDEDLPYYYVQLPNFSGEIYDIDRNGNTGNWAPMREVQRSILPLPGTGMIVTMDLGEDNDIHPLNKKDVGVRLAMMAMADLYGLVIEYEGPMIREVIVTCIDEAAGDYQIRVLCDKCRGGLLSSSKNKSESIEDFEVLDSMGNSYGVHAKLGEDMIELECNGMKAKPDVLRYCYSNTNKGALIYNFSGFLMSPFTMKL